MAKKKNDQAPAAEDLQVTNAGVDLSATDLPADNNENTDDQAKLTPAEEAQRAADPTPAQEAALQGQGEAPTFHESANPSHVEGVTTRTPEEQEAPAGLQIDASGIGTETNQDFIDNLPKNDQGQVVIGEDGRYEGLPDDQQPLPSAVTTPASSDSSSSQSSKKSAKK